MDQMSGTSFITGLDLSESFFHEVVEPILGEMFSDLEYSAALIGSGSEVLGFDTEMSADHHWGPRVMLFLNQSNLEKHQRAIKQILTEKLPRKFRGYPTSFSEPDLEDKGIRLLDYSEVGPINHRVEMTSVRGFLLGYLDFDLEGELHPADWLTFPEQKLRAITSGRVFRDQLDLVAARKRFAYYPHDVWLYVLACCWMRIEQEEHLMGRAGIVGDEIGSAIIGSRLVRDLMRLSFLMERCYAPYPKWFGTAFSRLKTSAVLEPLLRKVLLADNWKGRQNHLSEAYEYVAQLHNALDITEPMSIKVSNFFDRPFMVISMGTFSRAIVEQITDPEVKTIAKKRLIGNIDMFSDSTDLLSEPCWRATLRDLYN